MRVSRSHNIGACGMDLGVNREGGSVDWILPFRHLAAVVYQNQIGGANLTEVNTERIDPEVIEALLGRGP